MRINSHGLRWRKMPKVNWIFTKSSPAKHTLLRNIQLMHESLKFRLRAYMEVKTVRNSRYFSKDWYLHRYPDVKKEKVDPALHYCMFGWREGRQPGPQFDSVAYLQLNSDVKKAGINPLYHFERYGRKENRSLGRYTPFVTSDGPKLNTGASGDPHSGSRKTRKSPGQLQANTRSSQVEEKCADEKAAVRCELLNSGFWDEDWYLSQYYDAFTRARKTNGGRLSPLDYYIEQGWRLGHRPSEKFSISDPAPVDCNPVTYFLNHIRFEGYHFEENVWIPDDAEISDYLDQLSERKAIKVVYTCITNNYNKLMQPYCIDPEWDYVCFTDCESLLRKQRLGVWEIRKIAEVSRDYSMINRWHKINPHLLFPDYEQSLYVDGNINIISSYIYRKANSTTKPLFFPRHFGRNCAYTEMEQLMLSPRISEDNKKLLEKQYAVYTLRRFPENYGLTENNVIYRKHHSDVVKQLMKQWWTALCEFSSRDQASLSYLLWKNDIAISDITIPNIRINYKDFWIVKHLGESPDVYKLVTEEKLTPAFGNNTNAVVMSCNQNFVSYLGVVLTSIVENANPDQTYDIIILESDIENATKHFIQSAFEHHDNVSIRFYNMGSALSQLGNLELHVDGYVPLETYNKIFLSEITSGYKRIAYIDTDIVVNADISELCQVELWGKSLGSSTNIANIHAAHVGKEIRGRNFREYIANELGIEDYNKYFQAGILVLDMTSPRVMNLFSLSIEKLKSIKKPVFYDQCIFNSIFYGDVSFFSVSWNHVWYLQNYSYLRHTISERAFFDYARSRIAPKIVHFASKDKPTNQAGWDLAEYFWRYAKKSPYFDEILDEVAPVIRTEVETENVGDGLKRMRQPRVLVHLHIYYPDQIGYMLNALKNISGCEANFCITASDGFNQIVDRIRPELPESRFIRVANKGYDAYPFLKVLYDFDLSKFDYILKLHTKNSRPDSRNKVYGIEVPGHTWRNELVGALLGSQELFREHVHLLENDISVGAIGAGKYLFSTLENNEENTYRLAEWRATFDIEESTHYFGGTMFLARAFPFERFKRERLEAIDFEGSKLASGSHKDKAHAFERLFGLVIESEGFALRGVVGPSDEKAA